MEEPHRPKIEVVINRHYEATNGPSRSKMRPLSVDEALQYSPFTTSISSGHDGLLVPELGQIDASTRLTTSSERKQLRRSLAQIDQPSTRQPNQQNSAEVVRKNLEGLLDGDTLSEFKFKAPPVLNSYARSSTGYPQKRFVPQMSWLAKMVLESSDIAYRYPTPSTPSPKISVPPSLPTPALSISSEPSFLAQNQESYKRNQSTPPGAGKIDVAPKLTPVVFVPPLPASSQREDYQTIPDSPKRRKLVNNRQSGTVAFHVRAQKEEADATLSQFQDLLLEIFETEDRLQPDTSNTSSSHESTLFEALDGEDDYALRLSTQVQSKLQNAIKKLIGYKRLADIPTSQMKRLQKLCEPSLVAAQTMELNTNGSADGAEQWRARLIKAENGATSACTVIQIILGCQHEKELCPEDVIQCLPNVLTNVFENCLIPVVEARSSGHSVELFQLASESKDILGRLLYQGKKLLDLVTSLCVQLEGAEGAINAVEFLATKLIFVENASTEKDSVLGSQRFKGVRETAMEALAKISARFPDQRSFILDEILTSLAKLPSTQRSARQYKLADGTNIQLLTALVMQLVQTSSLESPASRAPKKSTEAPGSVKSDLGSPEDNDEMDDDMTPSQNSEKVIVGEEPSIGLLVRKSSTLYGNATSTAQYVIRYFVQRAMTSTKTGDEPYRVLLDLFTEDLLAVLGSTDWPASELLLLVLALHMLNITKDDKSSGNAKNMALESFGKMGSAITALRAKLPHMVATIHESDSGASHYLEQLAEDQLRGAMRLEEVVNIHGSCRMVYDYLQSRSANNRQLSTAQGYYLVQWAKTVCSTYKLQDLGDNETDVESETDQLAHRLCGSLNSLTHLIGDHDVPLLTPPQARLAYAIIVLNMDFCKLFEHIVRVLLTYITSDQANLRGRSLASLESLLDQDPSLLDRDQSILRVIFQCRSDQSANVRKAALSLIEKCMLLNPALKEDACKAILGCVADVNVGVRKKSMGLLKDIYQRDSRRPLKALIGKALLEGTADQEDSVSSMARQTLMELWLTPLLSIDSNANDSAKAQVAIIEQASIIIATIASSPESLLTSLEAFVRAALSVENKLTATTFEYMSYLVANLFERVLSSSEESPRAEKEGLLMTLTAFAKANARLVVPEQLQTLRPYLANLVSQDDLFFFKSVVVICRCVLPYLSSSHTKLLNDIQNDLFKTIPKLARSELNEVMACLWTIDSVLKNTDRLVRLTLSVLKKIHEANVASAVSADNTESNVNNHILGSARSYIRIAGSIGKYCDLEQHRLSFQKAFPTLHCDSVAGLMADLVLPSTSTSTEVSSRIIALESLGAICQSWPGQFNKPNIHDAFSAVFDEGSTDLQSVVLRMFTDFFGIREGAKEASLDDADTEHDDDLGRLGTSFVASDRDGAAALIAQSYLKPMLRVAVAKQDTNALTAIRVLASINRQGLVHPKETALVLVALETSTDPMISDIAYQSHRQLHEKHSTMYEREYMRAVQEAYRYQRDVVLDSSGATLRPYQAKLSRLFEVVKSSNTKYVKKFLSSLVQRTNFDVAKLDTSCSPPDHLLLTRFIMQNVAFFEFSRMDELLHTILQLENIVGKTGADVAQAIEAQLHGNSMKFESAEIQTAASESGRAGSWSEQHANVERSMHIVAEPALLMRLTAAAMILLLLWETRTQLRRQYGITQDVRQLAAKSGDTKDLSKAPIKVHGVSGEKYWDTVSLTMTSLDSAEAMTATCQQFATLMSIDDEVKVAAEGDEMRETNSASIGPEDESFTRSVNSKASRPGKRKTIGSVEGTPKTKRGRPSLKGRRRSSTNLFDDEDGGWD